MPLGSYYSLKYIPQLLGWLNDKYEENVSYGTRKQIDDALTNLQAMPPQTGLPLLGMALSPRGGRILKGLMANYKGVLNETKVNQLYRIVDRLYSERPNLGTAMNGGRFMKAFGKGPPGISEMPVTGYGGTSGPIGLELVYRDTSGLPKGFLSFDTEGIPPKLSTRNGIDAGLAIYVDPSTRGQGIANQLYDHATKLGFPVDDASGYHVFDAGEEFSKNRYLRRFLEKYRPAAKKASMGGSE